MTKLAEYFLDGGIVAVSNNGNSLHKPAVFIGMVGSDNKAVTIPQRSTVTVSMDAVAKMQAEREERLARMESGGSYWSEL